MSDSLRNSSQSLLSQGCPAKWLYLAQPKWFVANTADLQEAAEEVVLCCPLRIRRKEWKEWLVQKESMQKADGQLESAKIQLLNSSS